MRDERKTLIAEMKTLAIQLIESSLPAELKAKAAILLARVTVFLEKP